MRTALGSSLAALLILFAFAPNAAIAQATGNKVPGSFDPKNSTLTRNAVSQEQRAKITQSVGTLPLAFEINQGQAESGVRFLSHVQGSTLFLTGTDAVFDLVRSRSLDSQAQSSHPQTSSPQILHSVFRLHLGGDVQFADISGEDELPGEVNYFIGNDPKRWHTHVRTYRKVRYREIYPGVDLLYYGNQDGRLEHDFIVKPGADPSSIALDLGPVKNRVDARGNVILRQGDDELRLQEPIAYQVLNGRRKEVSVRYVLAKNGVRFALGPYDRSSEVIIDPVIVFSTAVVSPVNLGIAGLGVSVTLDSNGNIYLAGTTYYGYCGHGELCVPGNSSGQLTECTGPVLQQNNGSCIAAAATNTTNPALAAYPGDNLDVWVLKLNPTATSVIYGAYLGAGNGGDVGNYRVTAFGVDSNGRAVAAGLGGLGFPITSNAWANTCNASSCGFVSMLNPQGSGLVYSTFVDSGVNESYGTLVYGLAVDAAGRMYTTGTTEQAQWNFPGGFQTACADNTGYGWCYPSAFIAVFDPAQTGASSMTYFSYLGGSGFSVTSNGQTYNGFPIDTGFGVAVDSSQNAYITGYTNSANFPVTGTAYQATFGDLPAVDAMYYDSVNKVWVDPDGCATACADAFLTKVNTAASGPASLAYSTYLGGLGYDEATAIAVDGNGISYLTGLTCAPTFGGAPFPNTDNSAFTPTCPFLAQALSGATFITELDPTKGPDQALVHSSYFGDPNNGSNGNAIAVDRSSNVFVVGDGGTPALMNPFTTGYTGFLVKLNSSWTTLFSTTFPGTAWGVVERNGPSGIALDGAGNAYIASIGDPGFPAYSNLGIPPSTLFSAFITKISNDNAILAGMIPAPKSLTFPNQNLGTSSTPLPVTLNSTGNAGLTINSVAINPPSSDFSVSASDVQNCLAGSPTTPPSWPFDTACAVNVTFTPAATGTRTATLQVQSTSYNSPMNIPLTGFGTNAPMASFSVASLGFGGVMVGTNSVVKKLKLTNSAASPSYLNITSISISGSYTQMNNCPSTLKAGASCTLSITFSPSAVGSIPGVVNIFDSATDSPQIVNLAGSGLSLVSISPPTLTFPSTPVGTTSAATPFTVSNNSNAVVSLSATASADYAVAAAASGGCGSTLSPRTKCTYNVTFTPSQNGAINGSVSVSGAFPAQLIDLSGTGSGTVATLAFAPANLTFKTGQLVGTTSSPLTVTVTNKGATAVNVTGLSGSGGFSVSPSGTVPCNGALAAGKRCTFSVTFTPPIQGVVKGSISVANTGSINPVLYNASGTGVPLVSFSPTSVTYPATSVGSFATATVNLVNNQQVNLNVSGMVASSEYQIHSTGCFNGPIAPGSSCFIEIWFWPTKTGTLKGTVSVTDDGATSPQVLPLTGTGQ